MRKHFTHLLICTILHVDTFVLRIPCIECCFHLCEVVFDSKAMSEPVRWGHITCKRPRPCELNNIVRDSGKQNHGWKVQSLRLRLLFQPSAQAGVHFVMMEEMGGRATEFLDKYRSMQNH